MPDVVVFGAGQIAEVASFYLEKEGTNRIVAYCVDRERRKADAFAGRPLFDWEEIESHFPPSQVRLFAPIGYAKMNLIRKERYLDGKRRGYDFITFIHPKASYYGTPVGENCFILEDNTIQPYSFIGDNVIMWSGNHIGHHSRIGDHAFIASHVVVSGGAVVGERCFLGVNAAVHDSVTLGEACMIGAGATVSKDLPDESVLTPADSTIARVPSSRLRI